MAEAARDDMAELVVDQPLADELERRGVHGVHAGDRMRFQLVHGHATEHADDDLGGLSTGYVGSFNSGDPTLASRAKEIARSELGAT